MSADKIDFTPSAQWAIFRKGLPTRCKNCQLMFRVMFASCWIIAAVTLFAGPAFGYWYRSDWLGIVCGLILGTLGTGVANAAMQTVIFGHIKRCSLRRAQDHARVSAISDEELTHGKR